MARGARVALQTALGAISGGLGGYVRQKEMQREQDRLKAQEERQKSRDIFDLMQAGFMRPEELTQRQQAVTRQGGELASQALMSALNPRAGAPMTAASGPGAGALSEAMATAGRAPSQRLTYGGQEFVRAEAPMEQERRVRALEREQEQLQRKAEMQGEQEFRATEAQRGREFTAEQNRLERLARRKETAGDLSQLVVQRASALRDDFRAEPTVKKSETIADATRLVRAAAASPTAAGDLSLIFAYMRVLDPNSVVREREFANAQNAANVPDQIRNLYNRVLEGTRLNPRQRRDFVARANDIAQEQSKSIQAQITRFGRISERYGVPSDLVVYDPFEGLFEQAEPAPAIGGTGSPRDVTGGMPEMSRVDLSGNPYRRGARP